MLTILVRLLTFYVVFVGIKLLNISLMCLSFIYGVITKHGTTIVRPTLLSSLNNIHYTMLSFSITRPPMQLATQFRPSLSGRVFFLVRQCQIMHIRPLLPTHPA